MPRLEHFDPNPMPRQPNKRARMPLLAVVALARRLTMAVCQKPNAGIAAQNEWTTPNRIMFSPLPRKKAATSILFGARSRG